MSKNIYNQFFDLQVHLPGIVILHKFEIFHKHGRIYRFEGKFNKYSEDRWRPNNFMQSLSVFFFVFWWQKNNISFKFLFTFNPWLLNSFDLPSSGIEEKIHTKAASDVSRGEEF